jgi:hypothetical protein
VSPFTARAQIVLDEKVYGRFRDPTEEEMVVIDAYREKYKEVFGEYPAGTHWVDGVSALVSLLRPGGITSSSGV